MVDLMCDKPGETPVEDGDVPSPIDIGMFDVDRQRARYQAPDVEETQASLVLFVAVRGLLDDPGIEQGDCLPVRSSDDRGGTVDPDLGCGDPHPLTEGMQGGDTGDGRDQFRDDAAGILILHRKIE